MNKKTPAALAIGCVLLAFGIVSYTNKIKHNSDFEKLNKLYRQGLIPITDKKKSFLS